MTQTDATIRSARLDLVTLPTAAIEALLVDDSATASALIHVGLPAGLGLRNQALLVLRLGHLRAMPGAQPWLLRVVALRGPDRPMVGLCGFHGPPDISGTAELGYEIDPAHRRQRYAAEAAAALSRWALMEGGARRVIAAIRPDNEASLGVARRVGFVPAGSRWDVLDGTSLLFERLTPPPVAEWEDAATIGEPTRGSDLPGGT